MFSRNLKLENSFLSRNLTTGVAAHWSAFIKDKIVHPCRNIRIWKEYSSMATWDYLRYWNWKLQNSLMITWSQKMQTTTPVSLFSYFWLNDVFPPFNTSFEVTLWSCYPLLWGYIYFILGLNFILLCFKLIIHYYSPTKQRRIKCTPIIKLNQLWNCTHFRHPTDEQLRHVDIYFSNYCNLQSVHFESIYDKSEYFVKCEIEQVRSLVYVNWVKGDGEKCAKKDSENHQ